MSTGTVLAGCKDEKLREREWKTAQMAKRQWARKRIGKSAAQIDKFERGDIADKMMQE